MIVAALSHQIIVNERQGMFLRAAGDGGIIRLDPLEESSHRQSEALMYCISEEKVHYSAF